MLSLNHKSRKGEQEQKTKAVNKKLTNVVDINSTISIITLNIKDKDNKGMLC